MGERERLRDGAEKAAGFHANEGCDCDSCSYTRKWRLGFDAGYDAALSLDQWVPVSDDFPEPGERLLVTVLSYGSQTPVVEPCIVYRDERGRWFEDDGNEYEDEPIAGMPLPKPYKPQEGE